MIHHMCHAVIIQQKSTKNIFFWLLNFQLCNFTGNFRVHPTPANPAPEQPVETLRREGEWDSLFIWHFLLNKKAAEHMQVWCNIQKYCFQLRLDSEPSCLCLLFVDNKSDACLHTGELIVNTSERGVLSEWLSQNISHLSNISRGAVVQ